MYLFALRAQSYPHILPHPFKLDTGIPAMLYSIFHTSFMLIVYYILGYSVQEVTIARDVEGVG